MGEEVSIDHGRLHVFVAEEFLHGANSVAVFEQVGSEAVAERVATDALVQLGQAGSVADGFLQGAFFQVVAPDSAAARVGGETGGGE